MTGVMVCVTILLVMDGMQMFQTLPVAIGTALVVSLLLACVILRQDESLAVWLRHGPFSAFGFLLCLLVLSTMRVIEWLWIEEEAIE